MSLSGGCQCGAVRFRVDGDPARASICHCRMCQKAFAGPFGALVTVEVANLTWTRGAPTNFQSSDWVKRGFCVDCGTQLTFDYSSNKIDLAIFAFDDPSAVTPVVQLAVRGAVERTISDQLPEIFSTRFLWQAWMWDLMILFKPGLCCSNAMELMLSLLVKWSYYKSLNVGISWSSRWRFLSRIYRKH